MNFAAFHAFDDNTLLIARCCPKNMAIVSLVCGIVGIVGSFIPYVSYVAPLCAIAGIVFGALALKNVKAGNCEGNEKGLATAGLVLGIVSTAVSVLMFACAICAICAAASLIAAASNS